MKNDWIQIFNTTQMFEANVIEALLQDNGIEVYTINKQDSAYGSILPGSIEIYTLADKVEAAQELVEVRLADAEMDNFNMEDLKATFALFLNFLRQLKIK